jgi:flap endonuclease-1
MGVQISDIVPKKEIEFLELKEKVIAIDAMNTLYQFLTTIRQQDGTPLMDKNGEVTSHISGLVYRNLALLEEGIKPIYVFDGIPSELKAKELRERAERKELAGDKYQKAKEEGDFGGMKKYSSQMVKVNSKLIEESKIVLNLMGIPFVSSKDEGEAEAAALVKRGFVWASASQDYDSLLYGATRLIRNLTLARKRRSSSGIMVDTQIELIELQSVLDHLMIGLEQLICLGILVGTDFNPGGVRGIGQRKALEIVQKYKYPIDIFGFVEKSEKYSLDFNWQEVFREFKEYDGNGREDLSRKKADLDRLKDFLISRDFSEERVNSILERLRSLEEKSKQKGLKEFF